VTDSEALVGAGYQPVAHEDNCPAERGQPDSGAEGVVKHRLIAPRGDSPLQLDVVQLDADARLSLGCDPDRHELVYVLQGAVELWLGGAHTPVVEDSAFLVDGTIPGTVRAQGPARLAVFGAGRACDEHAPLGEPVISARLDLDDVASATGRRSFQVLLGPENGCCRATLFVGVVPPGAAPWHFHQYDEIVYLLDGAGTYHQAGGAQSTRPGSAVRIPSRTVHINENGTDAEMRVLGVFTPAGSPAAAYLADDPRPS
jgi:quercetin dioxygenase-like cupin family protein